MIVQGLDDQRLSEIDQWISKNESKYQAVVELLASLQGDSEKRDGRSIRPIKRTNPMWTNSLLVW